MSSDPEQTLLAKNFTVGNYKAARNKAQMGDAAEKNKIADAIHRRFTERYIDPAMKPTCRHGFTMMAISCLMIEALESFRRGWINSNNKSEVAFCYFFNSNDNFKDLRSHCEQFYKNVRCGILHQAETTGGWKITRASTAPLFEAASLKLNAERFLDNLAETLNGFCGELKTANWNSQEWKNVVRKMNALCDNCRRPGQ